MIPWFWTGHRAETIRKAENPPLPPGVQELPSLSLLQPHAYFSYVTTLVFGITVLLTHTVISQGDQHKSITSDFLSLFSGKQHRANQGGNEPSLRAFLAGLCLEAVLCRVGVMAPATSSAGSSPRLLQQWLQRVMCVCVLAARQLLEPLLWWLSHCHAFLSQR